MSWCNVWLPLNLGKLDLGLDKLSSNHRLGEMKKDILERLREAVKEASGPLCSSYEYDPTPTADERLNTLIADVKEIICELEKDL